MSREDSEPPRPIDNRAEDEELETKGVRQAVSGDHVEANDQ